MCLDKVLRHYTSHIKFEILFRPLGVAKREKSADCLLRLSFTVIRKYSQQLIWF